MAIQSSSMNLLKELSEENIGVYKENELATIYADHMTIRYQKRELLIDCDCFSLNVFHNYSTEPLRNGSRFNNVRITARGYSFNLIKNKSYESEFNLHSKSWLKILIDGLFKLKNLDSNSFLKKYNFKGSQTLKSKIALNEDVNEFLMENEVYVISMNNTYLVSINPREEEIDLPLLKYYIEFTTSMGYTINQ